MAGNLKTFNFKMNMGASASVKHSVNHTQFGDGYAQRVSFGINNKRKDWTGSKTGDYRTVILPIMQFLDEHAGIIPFCGLTHTATPTNTFAKIMKFHSEKAIFGRLV